MILGENDSVFRLRFRVGNVVQPPLRVVSRTADQAQAEAMVYLADRPGADGAEIALLVLDVVEV